MYSNIFPTHAIQIFIFFSIADPASGNTVDWAYARKNITLSYTYEFRPIRSSPGCLQICIFATYDSNGIFDFFAGIGFLLSASQIIPNSEEVIDGLVAMITEARTLKYF